MKGIFDSSMVKSGKKPIKVLASIFLTELGIDPRTVDLRTEGIPVPIFHKFVKEIYDLGYKDGLERYGSAQDELRKIRYEQKQTDKFKHNAKYMGESNVSTK